MWLGAAAARSWLCHGTRGSLFTALRVIIINCKSKAPFMAQILPIFVGLVFDNKIFLTVKDKFSNSKGSYQIT